MQNTPLPMSSINSKPTALLFLGVGTVMNVNPCAPPTLSQQQQNLHFARPFRDVLDQQIGVSGEDNLACWLRNGLASLHFNLLCCCEEATCLFSSQPIFF